MQLRGGVDSMLRQLISSGAIYPRPEDDAFLRDAMGMPSIAIEELHADQVTRERKRR